MKSASCAPPLFKFRWNNLLLVMTIAGLCLPACRSLTSSAKGRASNLKCEKSAGLVNGEMDAGVNITVVVTNAGEAGAITVRPEITTSEGEWSRSQELHFKKGESKTLTYFFDQPTINASNIECQVGVFPNAD